MTRSIWVLFGSELTRGFGVSAHFGIRVLHHNYLSSSPLTVFAGWPSDPRAASTTASLWEGRVPRS